MVDEEPFMDELPLNRYLLITDKKTIESPKQSYGYFTQHRSCHMHSLKFANTPGYFSYWC